MDPVHRVPIPRSNPVREKYLENSKINYYFISRKQSTMELLIYGDIGTGNNTGEFVRNEIKKLKPGEPLDVIINSPGGSVAQGMAIYNLIRSTEAQTTSIIEGVCGSIATLIALASDRVFMAETGIFQIHNPRLMAVPPVPDQNGFAQVAKTLENIANQLMNVYQSKTGLPIAIIEKMMDDDTDMNARDAFDLGFVDEVVNPVKKVASIDEILKVY